MSGLFVSCSAVVFSQAVAWAKRTFQYMFGLSLPLISHMLPRACTITTVVGAPIPVQRVEKPSDAQVAELLERYTAALTKLYDENCAKYTPHVTTPLRVL